MQTPYNNVHLHTPDLLHAEIDTDYELQFLNMHLSKATIYLTDSESVAQSTDYDIIPELVTWKSARAPSAMTLPMMPGVAHVWVPRW